MSVTFIVAASCWHCGWRGLGWSFRQAKVTMTTLRTTGVGVICFPRWCDECGGPMDSDNVRFRLDDESQRRVVEWRERQRARRAARRAAA